MRLHAALLTTGRGSLDIINIRETITLWSINQYTERGSITIQQYAPILADIVVDLADYSVKFEQCKKALAKSKVMH